MKPLDNHWDDWMYEIQGISKDENDDVNGDAPKPKYTSKSNKKKRVLPKGSVAGVMKMSFLLSKYFDVVFSNSCCHFVGLEQFNQYCKAVIRDRKRPERQKMEEELMQELLKDRLYRHSQGGGVMAKHKKKPPKKKPVKTFNELFAPLDEAIKSSGSLKDSDDVDEEPVSATVASTPAAVAPAASDPAASAPVVATTATFMPAVTLPVGTVADVFPASSGGGDIDGDVEPDLDDDLCYPVAMAASQILYSNLEPNLAAEDFNNVLVFSADDGFGV